MTVVSGASAAGHRGSLCEVLLAFTRLGLTSFGGTAGRQLRPAQRPWFIAVGFASTAALATQPAIGGPPFRTDDPVPVEYRQWEVYGFSQATHVRGNTSGVLPALEVNYGAAPDLQLHLVAPAAFDKASGGGMQYGYGDTELGAKYRFVESGEGDWWPTVGVFPLVELPTGDEDRGLGAGRARAFLPIWLQKDFGPWTTYGGGGYWVNPGPENKNFWFVGWLVQRRITEKLTLGAEVFHETADTIGGTDSTGFNLGGYYDFTDKYHLLFSAGRGMQHTADTNKFSYYLGFQVTF